MGRIVMRAVLGLLALAATLPAASTRSIAADASTQVALASAQPTVLPASATAFPTAAPTVTATAPSSTPTPTLVAQIPAQPGAPAAPPVDCVGVSPYTNYKCLDAYLGDDIFGRLWNYYKLEWGQPGPPTDPNAGPTQTPGFPRIGGTIPPLAYTDWPTGAMETIGDTQPNGADAPLMVAIANTSLGQWMQNAHLQFYGWVEPGINFSTNQGKAGNGPIGYTYNPNTIQLDQFVLYLDRWVDTVQTDHFDWGFRLSGLYGENYRYTNSFGVMSWQFNGDNRLYGFDPVMEYADFYWPQPFNHLVEGLEIRVGRYISIPDIEAQLAPNNLTYTHSLTYTWDNYTNTGIVTSWQVTPSFLVQAGITDGTETPVWHLGETIPNLMPGNPLYPGATYPKDPGSTPSATFCMQFKWNNGWDTLYPCLDGINSGKWGYNNLQWHGFTYYHRFDDQWHNDFESYFLSEDGVPNLRNPTSVAIFNGGGTPFSPQNVPNNPPNLAYCESPAQLSCDVHSIGVLDYINYTPDPLNNITMRLEWYDDPNGWRTGTSGRTEYYDTAISWQHWLSPQITFRPEISYWHSVGAPAFSGFTRHDTAEFAADMIFHF